MRAEVAAGADQGPLMPENSAPRADLRRILMRCRRQSRSHSRKSGDHWPCVVAREQLIFFLVFDTSIYTFCKAAMRRVLGIWFGGVGAVADHSFAIGIVFERGWPLIRLGRPGGDQIQALEPPRMDRTDRIPRSGRRRRAF